MLAKLTIRVFCPICGFIMAENDDNEKLFCSVVDCANYRKDFNVPQIFINLGQEEKIILGESNKDSYAALGKRK